MGQSESPPTLLRSEPHLAAGLGVSTLGSLRTEGCAAERIPAEDVRTADIVEVSRGEIAVITKPIIRDAPTNPDPAVAGVRT
jgi:hypothetical protein